MKKKDYNMAEHGFVGHLAIPDNGAKRAVIVIMGGEQSLLPGTMIAARFADYGFCGLAVSLFGAEGLPEGVDRVPLEMFRPAVKLLKDLGMEKISIYGMSMGSIFAALVAQHIGGIDNIIMCSPSHVPFEGTVDKKQMSGHSIATLGGEDIPFVKPDFSCGNIAGYVYDKRSGRKVTRMWCAFRDAYDDKEREAAAKLHLEKTGARILLIAGGSDEDWDSEYSVNFIKNSLDEAGYDKDYKMLVYPHASHLIGMMPNRKRHPWLYRALPVISIFYRAFLHNRKACLKAFEDSEKEIINWLKA
ncbi:acyl-CoA thioester hydrolase/BAAT C-terminal domain-containing protein [Ruminococcus sp.]|uniref:acyl-CoA thioester hydrolase/BAAT C-terminal domain-containing protein n=1 Tax=Ruminococcus sp. TaxID=41978 RepID=UPI0025D418D8|nr:acyl-CoA thioester hydrolase/BAAT C-terminal domain-containing protein [Ruminococcus sp.]MBQ8967586.1 hypothetical protein [Ruminococcus sp.]